MTSIAGTVVPVAIPATAAILGLYRAPNLADAYAVALPEGTEPDAERLARHIFGHQPRWIGLLMTLRDALVAGLGLKTARQLAGSGDTTGRVGIFKIYSRSSHEVVLGEDDRHLDFRLSLLRTTPSPGGSGQRLVLSTVVQCHNRLGRAYLFVIAPFHRMVVKASLRRAAGRGWPVAGAAAARPDQA